MALVASVMYLKRANDILRLTIPLLEKRAKSRNNLGVPEDPKTEKKKETQRYGNLKYSRYFL